MVNATEATSIADHAWSEIDFLGGALAVDFANTLTIRDDGSPEDRLATPADLARWMRAAGIETAMPEGEAADRLLGSARSLRAAIRALFQALAEGEAAPEDAVDRLCWATAEAQWKRSLTQAEGRFAWRWLEDGGSGEGLLWRVALSATEILTRVDPARFKSCPGDDCHWFFIDTSKNASRRWCDMALCGNRAKARRHYAGRRAVKADAAPTKT